MDVTEAVKLLRPQTAKNLRKLAAWIASEAECETHAPSRASAAGVAFRLNEEANWITFQLGCEKSGPAVLARQQR